MTKNVRDWKEIFDVGPAGEGGKMTPQWPERPPSFRPAVEAFYKECEEVSKHLVAAIARSLGAGEDALDDCFAQHTSYLRLNYYPRCDDPADPKSPTVPEKGEYRNFNSSLYEANFWRQF